MFRYVYCYFIILCHIAIPTHLYFWNILTHFKLLPTNRNINVYTQKDVPTQNQLKLNLKMKYNISPHSKLVFVWSINHWI